MSSTIPSGFALIETKSAFIEENGPFYYAVSEPELHVGVWVRERHCNALGLVHGGMIATIADFAMGRALGKRRQHHQGLVTLSLNLDYVGGAGMGAWLDTFVQIKKESGNIAFATCEIRDGARIALAASGVFKFVKPRT